MGATARATAPGACAAEDGGWTARGGARSFSRHGGAADVLPVAAAVERGLRRSEYDPARMTQTGDISLPAPKLAVEPAPADVPDSTRAVPPAPTDSPESIETIELVIEPRKGWIGVDWQ